MVTGLLIAVFVLSYQVDAAAFPLVLSLHGTIVRGLFIAGHTQTLQSKNTAFPTMLCEMAYSKNLLVENYYDSLINKAIALHHTSVIIL